MLVVKSLICGTALAALFEIYAELIGKEHASGGLAASLAALAIVFLVSNLVHWLMFRNPAQRTLARKALFSFFLWFFFFLGLAFLAFTTHRDLAKELEPTAAHFLSFFGSCMGIFGLPLAALNCLIAAWSEPAPQPNSAGLQSTGVS